MSDRLDTHFLSLFALGYLHVTLGLVNVAHFYYGQRNVARYQKALQESSRRDNDARIAQGQDPLDENGVPMKAPQAPSRLETFLIQNVLRDYCDQVQSGTSLAFNQLYVSKALQSRADDE